MPEEDLYPTVRFYRCTNCSYLYTGSLTGNNPCPKCQARAHVQIPEESKNEIQFSGYHAMLTLRNNVLKIQEIEELKIQLSQLSSQSLDSLAFLFPEPFKPGPPFKELIMAFFQSGAFEKIPMYLICLGLQKEQILKDFDCPDRIKIMPDLDTYQLLL